MVGSLMPGHAATGTDPGQPGVVRVEDHAHPSTEHLNESRWTAQRRVVQLLQQRPRHRARARHDGRDDLRPRRHAMGYDHPISLVQALRRRPGLGHRHGPLGSHYQRARTSCEHLVGGVKYAAGLEEGDCGGTVWDNFEKVSLDQNTSAPSPWTSPRTAGSSTPSWSAARSASGTRRPGASPPPSPQDVYSGGEDGLLGIALDPDFADQRPRLRLHVADAADNTDPRAS